MSGQLFCFYHIQIELEESSDRPIRPELYAIFSGCRHDVTLPGNCHMSHRLRQRYLNVTKWLESPGHTASQCVRKFLYKIPRVKQIFLIDGDKFKMINLSVYIFVQHNFVLFLSDKGCSWGDQKSERYDISDYLINKSTRYTNKSNCEWEYTSHWRFSPRLNSQRSCDVSIMWRVSHINKTHTADIPSLSAPGPDEISAVGAGKLCPISCFHFARTREE